MFYDNAIVACFVWGIEANKLQKLTFCIKGANKRSGVYLLKLMAAFEKLNPFNNDFLSSVYFFWGAPCRYSFMTLNNYTVCSMV